MPDIKNDDTKYKEWLAQAYASADIDDLNRILLSWGKGRWAGGASGMLEVQDNVLQLLENLGEVEPQDALRLAMGWLDHVGDVSTTFNARVKEFETRLRKRIAEENALKVHECDTDTHALKKPRFDAHLPRIRSPKLVPDMPQPGKRKANEVEESSPSRPENVRQPLQAAGMQSEPGDDRWQFTTTRK